ncbi:chemotaxis protein CheX [Pectinatus haikarae]|uniref:Chemotaxis protein CheX n=1 Tax=Pectinatus haikarae TaxID=349096 RepID=A0ABT9Y7Y7_9FIRM|nr:chemotaxis protein CheX [Pectinatus haikarae]MDQ0203927.1 chemotaxis protein CheX [Pectinatus haikarae]
MDVNIINPVLTAFKEILPQIGIQNVEKTSLSLTGPLFSYKGILLNIAVVGSIKGAILITMDKESAKKVAAKMMMGMEVTEFNDLALSALSEMGNMVCANACTQFSKIDVEGLDISPPTLLMSDTECQVTLPVPKTISIDLLCDNIPIKLHVGLM